MNWISVETQKPEKHQVVLVYSPVDGIGLATLSNQLSTGAWYWIYKKINGSKSINVVTHWMAIYPPENPHIEACKK